jgi:cytochrome c oxidase subunit 2
MIKFLIYVAIILAVLAVGYLVRVFELAQALKGRKSEEVTEQDNKMMAKVMLAMLVFLFGFTIWQLMEYSSLLLPEAASIHGKLTDTLLDFNFAVIWIVFALTQFLLFWFAYKYYGRKNNRATYFPHSNKLEMIWTVIPAIVLAVIIIFGLKTWNKITEPAAAESTIVQIYSKQFDWTARYAGKDNVLGESNYKLITATNELGMIAESKEGQDDIIVKNELHLPVTKKLNLNSILAMLFIVLISLTLEHK